MSHTSIVARIDELLVLVNSIALINTANVDNMAETFQIAYDESVELRMRDAEREQELSFHNRVYYEFKSGNFDEGINLIRCCGIPNKQQTDYETIPLFNVMS